MNHIIIYNQAIFYCINDVVTREPITGAFIGGGKEIDPAGFYKIHDGQNDKFLLPISSTIVQYKNEDYLLIPGDYTNKFEIYSGPNKDSQIIEIVRSERRLGELIHYTEDSKPFSEEQLKSFNKL